MMTLKAVRIGVLGREALQLGVSGKVMGVTSTGAFLRIEDQIVFLTTLPYLSPYNLQVTGEVLSIQLLQPGDLFEVQNGKLVFQRIGSEVDTLRAEVWTPGAPVLNQNPIPSQVTIVNHVFDQIRTLEGDKGFLFLVNPIEAPDGINQESIRRAAQHLVTAYRQEDLNGVKTAIEPLLGAGGGLTPSGDDFLTGYFLYHIRSAQAQGVQPDFALLALDEVIQRAREKTTTISVNRLQAASYGWAEELFLSLLDAMFAPELVPLPGALAQKLLNFGHSSGVDTLVGIHYAISTLFRE